MKKTKMVIITVLLAIVLMVIFIPVAFAADVGVVSIASSLDDVAAVVLLAVIVEKVVDMIKAAANSAAPRPPGKAWPIVWFAVSSGIGITLCILFQVNIFEALGLTGFTPASYVAGQIVTGVAVGGGSGFVHDLIDRLKAGKVADKAYISETSKTDDEG